MNIKDWNTYFMIQAVVAALKSKDPSTKVGCYIADEENHPLSTGYNGFPAKIDESNFTWDKDKTLPYHKTKYAYVHHAEENAILHAKSSLKGARLYVTLFPCNACAKMITTAKIKEVYYLDDKNMNTEEGLASQIILKAAGIKTIRMKLNTEEITEMLKTQLNSIKMD